MNARGQVRQEVENKRMLELTHDRAGGVEGSEYAREMGDVYDARRSNQNEPHSRNW